MIHLLEIGPEDTQKAVKKQARKYAMTGGVEIALRSDLNAEQLAAVVEEWVSGLQEYPSGTSAYRCSHAYRILAGVLEHPNTPNALKQSVAQRLG